MGRSLRNSIKVAVVTYRLSIPSRRGKAMTGPCQPTKGLECPDASIMKVVVADEDEDVYVECSPDWQTLLNLDQRAEVEQLLTEFILVTDLMVARGKRWVYPMKFILVIPSQSGPTHTGLPGNSHL